MHSVGEVNANLTGQTEYMLAHWKMLQAIPAKKEGKVKQIQIQIRQQFRFIIIDHAVPSFIQSVMSILFMN